MPGQRYLDGMGRTGLGQGGWFGFKQEKNQRVRKGQVCTRDQESFSLSAGAFMWESTREME